MSELKKFYKSKAWTTFRQRIILDRGAICQECNRFINESKKIHLHHIIELNEENCLDTSISLNPDNTKILCHECHNKVHDRWQGYYKSKERQVYVVYGPPGAGKTTYVLNNMSKGDLVIDMDRLFSAVSLLPLYDKPNNLKSNVFAIRNTLIDNIKTRYGKFNNAWIIGGYADKYQRDKLVKDLGAELIFINADKEDCLYRLQYCNDYRQEHQEEWKEYIEKWFETFVE